MYLECYGTLRGASMRQLVLQSARSKRTNVGDKAKAGLNPKATERCLTLPGGQRDVSLGANPSNITGSIHAGTISNSTRTAATAVAPAAAIATRSIAPTSIAPTSIATTSAAPPSVAPPSAAPPSVAPKSTSRRILIPASSSSSSLSSPSSECSPSSKCSQTRATSLTRKISRPVVISPAPRPPTLLSPPEGSRRMLILSPSSLKSMGESASIALSGFASRTVEPLMTETLNPLNSSRSSLSMISSTSPSLRSFSTSMSHASSESGLNARGGNSPGNTAAKNGAKNAASTCKATVTSRSLTRMSRAMDSKIRMSKPHPFNRRFAETRHSFFPICRKNLRDNVPRKTKKKVGRGKKNSKGCFQRKQKANHRKNSRTWEGGQNKLFSKVPRWPEAQMRNKRVQLEQLNLAKLRYFIERGRLDARYPITQRHLLESGCVSRVKRGIKLFNVNDYPFPYKIDIEVSNADQSTIDVIRKVGGSVTIVYHDRVSFRAHLKPYKFDILPRTPRPTLERVHFLEKMKARGCNVKYIKPLWLIREEQRVKAELRETLTETEMRPKL